MNHSDMNTTTEKFKLSTNMTLFESEPYVKAPLAQTHTEMWKNPLRPRKPGTDLGMYKTDQEARQIINDYID